MQFLVILLTNTKIVVKSWKCNRVLCPKQEVEKTDLHTNGYVGNLSFKIYYAFTQYMEVIVKIQDGVQDGHRYFC